MASNDRIRPDLPMRRFLVEGTVEEMEALAAYLTDSQNYELMEDNGYSAKQKRFVNRKIKGIVQSE